MRAIVFDGSLRCVADRPTPARRDADVLIRVHLAGVCATDLEITRGYMDFAGVPGHEFVGTVEEGPDALRGKRVVGEINCVCGKCDLCTGGLANHCRSRTVLGIAGRDGAFADLLALPAVNCHIVPPELSDEEAVFVEPLAAAIQITRQVKLEPKLRVTVLGSGRLGMLVAQVLASRGCRPVVVGRNPETLGRLDRRGIQTALVRDVQRFGDQDLVVDCTGSPEGASLALKFVRPRGTIVMKSTCAAAVPLDLAPLVVNEVTLLGSRCGPFPEAIAALVRREVEVRSMIQRQFPLSRGLEAFETASKPGSLKILVKAGA